MKKLLLITGFVCSYTSMILSDDIARQGLAQAQKALDDDFHADLATVKEITQTPPKTVMAKKIGEEFQHRVKQIGDAIEAEQKQATKEEQDKLTAAKEAIDSARKELTKQLILLKSSSEQDKIKIIEMIVSCSEKIQTQISIAGAAFTVLSQLQGHSGHVFVALGLAPVGAAVQIVGPFVTNLVSSIHAAAESQDIVNAVRAVANVRLKDPSLQKQLQALQTKMLNIEQDLGKGCQMLHDVIEGVTEVKDKAVASMQKVKQAVVDEAKAFVNKLGISKFPLLFDQANEKRIAEQTTPQKSESSIQPVRASWDSSLVPKMIATATQAISNFNGRLDSLNPITRISNGNDLVTALIALNNTKQGKILGNKIVSGFDLTTELTDEDLLEAFDLFFGAIEKFKEMLNSKTTTTKSGLVMIYLDPAKNHLSTVKGELVKFVQETIPAFMGILTSDPDAYVLDYTKKMNSLRKFIGSFKEVKPVAVKK